MGIFQQVGLQVIAAFRYTGPTTRPSLACCTILPKGNPGGDG
jgi:hypothetical protein